MQTSEQVASSDEYSEIRFLNPKFVGGGGNSRIESSENIALALLIHGVSDISSSLLNMALMLNPNI
jgi:hypothetical protein